MKSHEFGCLTMSKLQCSAVLEFDAVDPFKMANISM